MKIASNIYIRPGDQTWSKRAGKYDYSVTSANFFGGGSKVCIIVDCFSSDMGKRRRHRG